MSGSQETWVEAGLVPSEKLTAIAKEAGADIYSEKFAEHMDSVDPLAHFRERYHIPLAEPHTEDCKEALYFCGNSLGVLPKKTQVYINEELEKWKTNGVEGHFNGARPWAKIDEFVTGMTAEIVGAKDDSEVAVMNTLSVNLHLMMTSFYQPTATRHKLMIEADAFCSDHHVVRSQIALHKLEESTSLIQLKPREGEATLRTEDIIKAIEEEGDSVALVMLGGVQFYTGQAFDMKAITTAGHAKGCYVGFDCAHAFGNFPLQLHDWGVDWAAWCTYKYMNAGPGCIGGIFVHDKHADRPNNELPRLAGWWGQEAGTRFAMKSEHKMKRGAQAYMLSNPPVLPAICLMASLENHTEAGMPALRQKSLRLTGYLEMLLEKELSGQYTQLTPTDPAQRGCQISILMKYKDGVKVINEAMAKRGVICDVRQPDVMRVAPTPMYNRFIDVYRFVHILKEVLAELK